MSSDTHARRSAATLTFLFTDIEGSTRLAQQIGDEYTDLLLAHRRLLRRVWQEHGGVEQGTEGDSFFVVFDRPRLGVTAAVAAQRALAEHDWGPAGPVRIRIGVHTGEVELADDDYVGLAIHEAARIAAAAHGGQIVISDVTRRLTPDVDAIDLGEHRLKDLAEPVRLAQVVAPGLPSAFPPLRSLSALPNNLPVAVDEFIGRHREVQQLVGVLGEARLVTLVGAGGTGKTRLALEVASRLLTAFSGGVWLVELAAADDGERVASMVAAALGLGERIDEPLVDTVERWLRDRNLLLILDNAEHLLPAVATLATRLVRTCPSVHVLVTSRELLGVRGERAFSVPPLSLPDGDLGTSDAVSLFVARARAAAPDLDLAGAEPGLLATVCRRLDGLPLAIELAAARLRSLSLGELAELLDDRFRLLTGGRRTDLPRQRTLSAVVAWSEGLLDDQERALFHRVAVFAGSFDLDTARAVTSGDPLDDLDVVDVLGHLVDKSLVSVVSTSAGGYHYHLLETLRDYGRNQLARSGEAEVWRARLLRWAVGRVERLEAAMRTPRQDAELRAALADRENLRSAMTWAIEQGDHLAALRIVSAAPVGLAGERRALIAELLHACPEAPASVQGQAHLTASNLASDQADHEAAIEESELAEALLQEAGEERYAAWARYMGLHGLWGVGRTAEVASRVPAVLDDFRVAGDSLGMAWVQWVASLVEPELDRAIELARAADALLLQVGSNVGRAHNCEGMAIIELDREHLDDATPLLLEALDVFASMENPGCTAHTLEAVAVLTARRGVLEGAAELLGAAEALRAASGQGHRPWEIRARHPDLDVEVLAGLPSRQEVFAAGRRHSLRTAVALARELLGDGARPPIG